MLLSSDCRPGPEGNLPRGGRSCSLSLPQQPDPLAPLGEAAGAGPLASRLAGPGRSSWEEGAAALGAFFLGPCTRLNVQLTEDGPQTSWEAAGTAVGLRNYTRPPGPVSGHPAGPGGSVGRGGPGAEDAPERQGRPSLAWPGLLAGGRVRTWAIEAPSGSKKRLRWRGPPEVLTRAGARSQLFHDGGRGVPAEHAAGSLRLTGPSVTSLCPLFRVSRGCHGGRHGGSPGLPSHQRLGACPQLTSFLVEVSFLGL